MRHATAPSPMWSDSPSGFRQLIGYRVADWKDGEATLELMIGPRHLNRSGLVHGGVLATLIDAAGGYAGTYCAVEGRVRRSLAVALNVQYIATVKAGTVRARARVRGGGHRIFMTTVEVRDSAGHLIATGEAVYRYSDGSESPDGVPRDNSGEKRDTDLG